MEILGNTMAIYVGILFMIIITMLVIHLTLMIINEIKGEIKKWKM